MVCYACGSPMTNPPQPPSGFRVGLIIFLGLSCLVLMVCLSWSVRNLSARRSLERYEQPLEARGERFAFADFVPQPVPDARNFALTPVVASCYQQDLDKNGHAMNPKNARVVNRLDLKIYGRASRPKPPTNSGNWAMGQKTDLHLFQNYYRALATRMAEFPVSPQPQSPATDVLLALSKYDPAIEELRRAATLPESRFPLNYDTDPPMAILLPHLEALKKCSQVLQLRAIAELQLSQSDKALADVELIFRLMASVRSEPFLISQLVRIDMLNLALQPVWEGTQEHRWSDSQLKELNEALSGLDFLADYKASVRGERALEIATIEYIRRTRDIGDFIAYGNSVPLRTAIELRFARSSVYYQNELSLVRASQEWVFPVVSVRQHRVSLEALRQAATNIDQMRIHWSLNDVMAGMFLPAFEIAVRRFCYPQSSVDMARVACALERCRLAQGKYPESLDSLAPRFMQSVPLDVINGQPLKYQLTAGGQFTLYSVGWNGTDDGGAVFLQSGSETLIDNYDGDWVWTGQVLDE